MTISYLRELFEIAVNITDLDALEDELTGTPEWKHAKAEFEAQEERFKKVRKEYVDGLLSGERKGDLVADVETQLREARERADPSWHRAIDYTRDELLPYLVKEAGRSPGMRRALKLAPYALVGIAALVYFGIRLASATPVTADIETREGLVQRAAAAEKVIRYDDLMGTRVRRGGWLKGILFWPIEPDDMEIAGAQEFVSLTLEGQSYTQRCGAIATYGDTLSDAELDRIDEVADIIQSDAIEWQDPPVMTVVTALEQAC